MKILVAPIAAMTLIWSSPAMAMHALYAHCLIPVAQAAAVRPEMDLPFEDSSEWEKLGESLKAAWLDAKQSGDLSQRIKCFVRAQGPFSSGDRNFLQSKGFNVRMVGGAVASGDVAAADLQAVAKLPFVRSVKLASK